MTQQEFEHIAYTLRPMLTGIGRAYFGSADEAEDVAQEALLRLWRYAESMDGGCDLSRLAARIAKWCCVDIDRRRRAFAPPPLPGWDAEAAHSPHDELVGKETQQLLDKAISQLSPRERELFEMQQLEGLPADEIAQRTGVSKTSVQSMVSRARKKVFDELNKLMKQ